MSDLSLVAPRTLAAPRPAGIVAGLGAKASLPKCVAVGALALAAAWAAAAAVRGPGHVVKNRLDAAGATVRELRWTEPRDGVQRTVAALFPGSAVSVDAAGFPARVLVTLQALDRQTCLDAREAARRIEGSVVVELRGFASPDDCRERNDMPWLILP